MATAPPATSLFSPSKSHSSSSTARFRTGRLRTSARKESSRMPMLCLSSPHFSVTGTECRLPPTGNVNSRPTEVIRVNLSPMTASDCTPVASFVPILRPQRESQTVPIISSRSPGKTRASSSSLTPCGRISLIAKAIRQSLARDTRRV